MRYGSGITAKEYFGKRSIRFFILFNLILTPVFAIFSLVILVDDLFARFMGGTMLIMILFFNIFLLISKYTLASKNKRGPYSSYSTIKNGYLFIHWIPFKSRRDMVYKIHLSDIDRIMRSHEIDKGILKKYRRKTNGEVFWGGGAIHGSIFPHYSSIENLVMITFKKPIPIKYRPMSEFVRSRTATRKTARIVISVDSSLEDKFIDEIRRKKSDKSLMKRTKKKRRKKEKVLARFPSGIRFRHYLYNYILVILIPLISFPSIIYFAYLAFEIVKGSGTDFIMLVLKYYLIMIGILLFTTSFFLINFLITIALSWRKRNYEVVVTDRNLKISCLNIPYSGLFTQLGHREISIPKSEILTINKMKDYEVKYPKRPWRIIRFLILGLKQKRCQYFVNPLVKEEDLLVAHLSMKKKVPLIYTKPNLFNMKISYGNTDHLIFEIPRDQQEKFLDVFHRCD